MKRINLVVFALLAIVVGFSSCGSNSSGVGEPHKIGEQVFNILKDFDATGRQGFVNNFPTIDYMRNLGKTDKLSINMEVRNDITSTSESEWAEQISNNYAEIQKLGKKHNINWNSIEYSDFLYEIENEEGGLKYVEGELHIQHHGEDYKIYTYSLWDGKKYILIQLDGY